MKTNTTVNRVSVPSAEYLATTARKLENAIAFNVSCPEMVAYQKAKLARVLELLSVNAA